MRCHLTVVRIVSLKRQKRTGPGVDVKRRESRWWGCNMVQPIWKTDADPGLQDLCVVAAMDQFTWTAEILWRKRDCTAAL